MTSRETAMIWWNALPFEIKWNMIVKHKSLITGYPDRAADSLTGSEIEEIHKTQLKS